MIDGYILDRNDNPILEDNFDRIIDWNVNNKTRVGNSLIGDKRISTVFNAFSNAKCPETDKPLLWETVVFSADNKKEIYKKIYCSKKDAIKGHRKAVKMTREGLLC
jgi:hypothetical protein